MIAENTDPTAPPHTTNLATQIVCHLFPPFRKNQGQTMKPRGRRGSSSSGSGFMVDMFKRIPREYQSASYLGGVLSATCAAVLTILVLLEFQAYLTVSYQSAVIFPGSTVSKGAHPYNPYVSIRFNVTFPHLPCEYLSAEMFDVYGRHAIQNTTVGDDDYDRMLKKDKSLDDSLEDEFDNYGNARFQYGDEDEGPLDNKVSMTIFKWRVTDEGRKRASVMEEHMEDVEEPIHEELPYHHAAHQYQDVVPLTNANFNDFVESKDVVMIDFYAPWCIWCKRLAPVWENFAHSVNEKDYSEFVGVAKVDCTTEVDICRRRRIAGYPSIFLYRDRNPHSHVPYRGDRTTSAFLEFIEGLGVESDHKSEVQDLMEDINNELHAEANVVRKAAFKDRDERKDGAINHPLKALTAPGGLLGPAAKDSALTGIMRALDQAGTVTPTEIGASVQHFSANMAVSFTLVCCCCVFVVSCCVYRWQSWCFFSCVQSKKWWFDSYHQCTSYTDRFEQKRTRLENWQTVGIPYQENARKIRTHQ